MVKFKGGNHKMDSAHRIVFVIQDNEVMFVRDLFAERTACRLQIPAKIVLILWQL